MADLFSKKQEKESLLQELTKNNPLHVEELTELSKRKFFCPYEISAELGKKAKVIIADYHHILNPSIRETLMKRTDKSLSSSIIIFDEAHNLVDKSRDLLTNKLTTQMLDYAIREAGEVKASSYVKEKSLQLEKEAKEINTFLAEPAQEETQMQFITASQDNGIGIPIGEC